MNDIIKNKTIIDFIKVMKFYFKSLYEINYIYINKLHIITNSKNEKRKRYGLNLKFTDKQKNKHIICFTIYPKDTIKLNEKNNDITDYKNINNYKFDIDCNIQNDKNKEYSSYFWLINENYKNLMKKLYN